ncbi:helix-turn-helix transcriptional regulator [Solwaraspora sp. WMMD1047]|uniref:helix-turn-helix domain-containing protein n=1 Tax=Solwaraspora sp. WMMD1047 TaxID=3016102 RepID=UPI002415A583|nr:helix-turn-helix transcriptional regulator [Solwaraspora sp. WMMD1047]MDG4834591.1 helix-turn-helix transcriptional regulator [Solwaraspora sp. WMMD1047]
MADNGSSVPRRQLGRMLRKSREEAGIALEAAAEDLEWSRAKMYRLEGGAVATRTHDVALMCQLYGTTDELTKAMVGLARESKSKGWWHAYGDVLPDWFSLYVGMEDAATRIREYEPALVPGLLQTPAYATAVLSSRPGATAEQVQQAVNLRIERQKILARRRPLPPVLELILDEAVLRRRADMMPEQLAHLLTCAALPRVSLRVLPLATGPHHACLAGAFSILEFAAQRGNIPEPTTIYSESLTGALYLDKPGEVATYDEAWRSLTDLALTEEESAALIDDIKEGFDA